MVVRPQVDPGWLEITENSAAGWTDMPYDTTADFVNSQTVLNHLSRVRSRGQINRKKWH